MNLNIISLIILGVTVLYIVHTGYYDEGGTILMLVATACYLSLYQERKQNKEFIKTIVELKT